MDFRGCKNGLGGTVVMSLAIFHADSRPCLGGIVKFSSVARRFCAGSQIPLRTWSNVNFYPSRSLAFLLLSLSSSVSLSLLLLTSSDISASALRLGVQNAGYTTPSHIYIPDSRAARRGIFLIFRRESWRERERTSTDAATR